jgi:hypothetical protein
MNMIVHTRLYLIINYDIFSIMQTQCRTTRDDGFYLFSHINNENRSSALYFNTKSINVLPLFQAGRMVGRAKGRRS